MIKNLYKGLRELLLCETKVVVYGQYTFIKKREEDGINFKIYRFHVLIFEGFISDKKTYAALFMNFELQADERRTIFYTLEKGLGYRFWLEGNNILDYCEI